MKRPHQPRPCKTDVFAAYAKGLQSYRPDTPAKPPDQQNPSDLRRIEVNPAAVLLTLVRPGRLDGNSTYVSIPGGWHGGWAWHPVAERLRAAGRRAVCLTLPGLGDGDDPAGRDLQDAVDYIVSEVEGRGLSDVTLVGHSWGGYPTTG